MKHYKLSKEVLDFISKSASYTCTPTQFMELFNMSIYADTSKSNIEECEAFQYAVYSEYYRIWNDEMMTDETEEKTINILMEVEYKKVDESVNSALIKLKNKEIDFDPDFGNDPLEYEFIDKIFEWDKQNLVKREIGRIIKLNLLKPIDKLQDYWFYKFKLNNLCEMVGEQIGYNDKYFQSFVNVVIHSLWMLAIIELSNKENNSINKYDIDEEAIIYL